MILNCQFCLFQKNHKIYHNKQGINIDNLTWKDSSSKIAKELLYHKPDDRNWVVVGFALIKN